MKRRRENSQFECTLADGIPREFYKYAVMPHTRFWNRFERRSTRIQLANVRVRLSTVTGMSGWTRKQSLPTEGWKSGQHAKGLGECEKPLSGTACVVRPKHCGNRYLLVANLKHLQVQVPALKGTELRPIAAGISDVSIA